MRLLLFAQCCYCVIPVIHTHVHFTHLNPTVHLTLTTLQSFAAALTAQYCEFFLYRGQGRPERAGNCKKGHAPNPRPLYEYAKKWVNFLRSRSHAKVHDKDEEGDEGENNDNTQIDEEEGAIKPKKRSKSPSKSGHNSNEEESDLEAGTSKKSRKSKEKGLKSALKKTNTADHSSEDEVPETNTESKKRRKKSEKRKNSATIVEEEEGHHAKRKSSNHSTKSGPLLELDKDGNVVEAKEVPHTDWNCLVGKRRCIG